MCILIRGMQPKEMHRPKVCQGARALRQPSRGLQGLGKRPSPSQLMTGSSGRSLATPSSERLKQLRKICRKGDLRKTSGLALTASSGQRGWGRFRRKELCCKEIMWVH